MKNTRLLLAILSCGMMVPCAAWAGIVTPLSSNRLVAVTNRETIPQTQISFTGPTVGPWQAQAQASNASGQPNFNPNGSAVTVTSSQQSDFSNGGIGYSGFVFIDYAASALPQLGTSATNRCDTVFHVEGDSVYQFQATLVANSVAQFTNAISLRNNAGGANLFSFSASGATSGTLATGDYTLSILISGSSSGTQVFDVRSQIDATFTIPAPAASLSFLAPLWLASRRRRP